jgi:hypothetical protein
MTIIAIIIKIIVQSVPSISTNFINNSLYICTISYLDDISVGNIMQKLENTINKKARQHVATWKFPFGRNDSIAIIF